MCEWVLVSMVFPIYSTREKTSVCCSNGFCTCGARTDEVWGNFTMKWNEGWNYSFLFFTKVCLYIWKIKKVKLVNIFECSHFIFHFYTKLSRDKGKNCFRLLESTTSPASVQVKQRHRNVIILIWCTVNITNLPILEDN